MLFVACLVVFSYLTSNMKEGLIQTHLHLGCSVKVELVLLSPGALLQTVRYGSVERLHTIKWFAFVAEVGRYFIYMSRCLHSGSC